MEPSMQQIMLVASSLMLSSVENILQGYSRQSVDLDTLLSPVICSTFFVSSETLLTLFLSGAVTHHQITSAPSAYTSPRGLNRLTSHYLFKSVSGASSLDLEAILVQFTKNFSK
ncbi:hypothetical protein T4D_3064 [Trichinella pseudospiralis]|uniref:Uncharacterized protein n=1 Tax=Trichinella pseudospiralis TaxID=6337 RepID=A0A0V1G5U6_TRIPS|nr:hypothetical protein T4D_3064 [Trichinella pseudospiralis]